MRFSTVAITSLLAAVVSAEMGIPAKRHLGAIFKRQDSKCGGYQGDCCETGQIAGGAATYTVCGGDSKCKKLSTGWCCCTDDKCTSCGGCGKGDAYGDGYTCWSEGGRTYYSPDNQAKPLSSAMAAPAEAATSEAAAAASSIGAEASAAISSVEAAGSSAAAALTSFAASASAAVSSAAAGVAATATGNETQPTATGPAASGADKAIAGVPALALVLLAGILML